MSITTALIISNIIVFLINNLVKVPAFYGVANVMSPELEPILYVRGAYSWFSTCGRFIFSDMRWKVSWERGVT